MNKTTKKDLIQIIKKHKKEKCPSYSNKKKDELEKIITSLGLKKPTDGVLNLRKKINKLKENKSVKKKPNEKEPLIKKPNEKEPLIKKPVKKEPVKKVTPPKQRKNITPSIFQDIKFTMSPDLKKELKKRRGNLKII